MRLTTLITTLSIIGLVGCGAEETSVPKGFEQTRTVEWFMENEEERVEIMKACANNPGELKGQPNCINAETAMLKASSGKLKKWDITEKDKEAFKKSFQSKD